MQKAIGYKLAQHLLKNSFDESDVVYILSRIRKLIEFNEMGSSGRDDVVLKFFCNWALHVQIDNCTSVSSLLLDIEQGSRWSFELYLHFWEALILFLEKNSLSNPTFCSKDPSVNN